MLTNPNTCGLFERDIVQIAEAVHAAGAYFYCDGANLNAIMAKVRPGDLGVDAMHLNLHKTFSTPHGGGGPGSGPVVLSDALARFAPLPYLVRQGGGLRLVEHREPGSDVEPFGRLSAFHGQMGMFVRAYAYVLSHGAAGLRQAAEDAVLNANYVRAGVQKALTQSFTPPGTSRPCMHEALFDDNFLKDTGVTTLDFAKAMIDEGYAPDDHVLPTGGSWCLADRADGVWSRALRSTSSSLRCVRWPMLPAVVIRNASPAPPTWRRCVASTRRRPRESRIWFGHHQFQQIRLRDRMP